MDRDEKKLLIILKRIDKTMDGYKVISKENGIIKIKDWVCTDREKYESVKNALESISWVKEVITRIEYDETERTINLWLTEESKKVVERHKEKENDRKTNTL